jgi:hypothetical protein
MREPVRDQDAERQRAEKNAAQKDRDRQRTAAARAALAVKQTRRIELLGWRAVDPNSPGAIACREWRDDLISTLGGDAAVTPQKRALIDAAAITKLMISRLDDLILVTQGSGVNVHTLEVAPFILQRETLIAGLRADLKMIGLGRRARPIHDLGEILATTDDTVDDSTDDDTQEDT